MYVTTIKEAFCKDSHFLPLLLFMWDNSLFTLFGAQRMVDDGVFN